MKNLIRILALAPVVLLAPTLGRFLQAPLRSSGRAQYMIPGSP